MFVILIYYLFLKKKTLDISYIEYNDSMQMTVLELLLILLS